MLVLGRLTGLVTEMHRSHTFGPLTFEVRVSAAAQSQSDTAVLLVIDILDL